jgi:hypothetical protein
MTAEDENSSSGSACGQDDRAHLLTLESDTKRESRQALYSGVQFQLPELGIVSKGDSF